MKLLFTCITIIILTAILTAILVAMIIFGLIFKETTHDETINEPDEYDLTDYSNDEETRF